MSVIIDLSIFPLNAAGDSLSHHVARAVDIIRKSGLPYQLGPMGTSIEGEWDEVMAVVGACYRELDKDFDRIYLNIKADCRRGRSGGLTDKVRSVKAKQQ